MKKNKKKLPRYWLGTKAPRSMGYLTPDLVGYLNTQTTNGIDISPEVAAMRDNLIPNTIGGITKNAWPMQMTLYMSNVTIPAATWTVTPSLYAAHSIPTASVTPTSNLALTAASTTGGKLLSGYGMQQAANTGAQTTFKLGQETTKNVIGTAGKVLGGLGAAYGALNVGMDFANAGSHRSAGDMMRTLNTNTVTTPGGNQYTTRSGFNKDAEFAYERYDRINKGIGLTTDAMGMFGAAGGLLGGLPGMLAGFGTGALFGLGAGLFGFGDNEDEVRHNARVVGDNIAMENRQNRTNAYDQDVKDAFYSRSTNGTIGAKDGKMPGFSTSKPNARVSNKETVGLMNKRTGEIVDLQRVPGKMNNKDSVEIYLPETKRLTSFVVTNKPDSLTGIPLSTIAANGYPEYALNEQYSQLKAGILSKNGNKNMNKNGRLPKFENGWLNYLPMALSHGSSLFNNVMGLNRAKEAPVYTADTYIANPEGTRAVNELGRLRFDADPYFTEANRSLRQALWDARRNVGLGTGGRAIAQNANQAAYFDKLLKITQVADEANNNYRNAYAQALFNLGQNNQTRRMQSAAQRHQWLQQANAAKENWMAQYTKNIDTNLLNMAADYGRMKQYQDALETQKKMLELYDALTLTDRLKAQAYINSLGNNKTTPTQTAAVSTYVPQLLARPTDDDLLLKVYATAPWRYKLASKPRSVDPYTNVYNLALWH